MYIFNLANLPREGGNYQKSVELCQKLNELHFTAFLTAPAAWRLERDLPSLNQYRLVFECLIAACDYEKLAILYKFDETLFQKIQRKLIHYSNRWPYKWSLYKQDYLHQNSICYFCKTSLEPAEIAIIYENIKQAKACLVTANLSAASKFNK
jgi:hypothetical protein